VEEVNNRHRRAKIGGGCEVVVGRARGPHRGLHPVVRGSLPRRSTKLGQCRKRQTEHTCNVLDATRPSGFKSPLAHTIVKEPKKYSPHGPQVKFSCGHSLNPSKRFRFRRFQGSDYILFPWGKRGHSTFSANSGNITLISLFRFPP